MYQFLSTLVTYFTYTFLGVTIPVLITCLLYPAVTTDIGYFRRKSKIERGIQQCLRNNFTIVDRYEELVEQQGTKTFLYYDGQEFTYSHVNKVANRLTNYLLEKKEVKLRDVVCMFMYNKPDFVWTWLAIVKCGATAALVNVHIRGKSLVHCIRVSQSKIIICNTDDVELLEALKEIKPELDELGIKIFVVGTVYKPLPEDFVDLTKLSWDSLESNNVAARRGVNIHQDSCSYFYTSGTTGLPKASIYSHRRMVAASKSLLYYDLTPDDIFYLCLPLYHAAAFTLGLMNVINTGGAAVIRKKFSVREFWNDVRRYRITVIEYIGETARYLVQALRDDQDGIYPHGSIKLAFGNGLPADIWREFKERFNIRRVGEFYGATDGNCMLVNLDGKEGTVGRYTFLQEKLIDRLQIIECDRETAEPRRGSDGLCIPCPKGKAGLLATKVSERFPFDAYVGDRKITEKKMIRDVLRKGDCYANTGDLMLIDFDGYVYFKDRLGNTFRWKGENVATTEVELALLENAQVESANVYGVKVVGKDGRAGMAALIIKSNETLDCPAMYRHITERLPSYACPKFIRVKEAMEVTGTFKLRKVNLMKEGFDPRRISEPLYYMNEKDKTYSILDEDSFNGIWSGTIRL